LPGSGLDEIDSYLGLWTYPQSHCGSLLATVTSSIRN
jgi:hypothetical protein